MGDVQVPLADVGPNHGSKTAQWGPLHNHIIALSPEKEAEQSKQASGCNTEQDSELRDLGGVRA